MKHFGAALASYGSVALFHMAGITPEARRLDDVLAPGRTVRSHEVDEADIRAFQESYAEAIETVDVVAFSAPQLSLVEMAQVAGLLDGRRATIPLLIVPRCLSWPRSVGACSGRCPLARSSSPDRI